MMTKTHIEKESKKNIENWTSEGWECLLQSDEYKDLAISTLSKILYIYNRVEFKHKSLFYEIFDSSHSGYVINIYSSAKKDEDGYYLEENMIDGGLCTGETRDAIEFML